MDSVKCRECGFESWLTNAGQCRRCGAQLGAAYQKFPARYVIDKEERIEPIFSGAVKVLSIMLGFTTLICLAQQIFHPFAPDTAKGVAVFFALPGVLLLVLTHIWLLIRIFEQSIGWGFASLFLPIVGLIAVIHFWEKTSGLLSVSLSALGSSFSEW